MAFLPEGRRGPVLVLCCDTSAVGRVFGLAQIMVDHEPRPIFFGKLSPEPIEVLITGEAANDGYVGRTD